MTNRKEIKFVTNELFLIQVYNWIGKSKLFLRKTYGDRIVNNIYYDTYGYNAYSDNLDGISIRSKLRYRWYGNSLRPTNGNLELKKRVNAIGTKDVKGVFGINENETHSSLQSKIKLAVNDLWLPILDYYSTPMILNRYTRSYFESKCGKIRVTLDRSHSVYDQRMSDLINTSKRTNTVQYLVVEVKFHPDLHDYVASMIGDIPMRISRNSKYINSINSIIF